MVLSLLVIAAVLFAYAASVPLWATGRPRTIVTTIDPEIVVELIALVVAVLALGSAAAYVLLRREVQETIRREIEQESVTPLRIEAGLLLSFMYYLEYSDMWRRTGDPDTVTRDSGFQWAVLEAVTNARSAYELARTLPSLPRFRGPTFATVDSLAYHLATQYLIDRDDRARREALNLMAQIETEAIRHRELGETVAWVQMACNAKGTPEFQEGLKTITKLLGYKDIPLQWRQVQSQKYAKVFKIYLPFPVA